MAKLRADEISEKDISEWIASCDDFDFELSVFHGCIERGITASHGGTYQDPITKKDRQFDIRAQLTKGSCTVRMAIECKNLRRNYPLLVSRVPMRTEESYHEVIISGRRRRKLPTPEPLPQTDTCRVDGTNLLPPIDYTGKSTAQIGRTISPPHDLTGGQDTEVFEKWSQAISSAFGLVKDSVSDYALSNEEEGATVILPILVVSDNTLWVADYPKDGASVCTPRQCDESTLYLGKDINHDELEPNYTVSHLLIFTKTKFFGYLHRLLVNDNYWSTLFPKNQIEQWFLEYGVKYQ